jgi:hypothetical protein
LVTRGFVVFAGLVAAPFVQFMCGAHKTEPLQYDSRVILLQQFFAERECPIREYAEDFVRASDQHGLDWRLLPGIAFVESGGGKAYKNNNIFGWNNAERRFDSIRSGIYSVASRLANSRLYRDKDTNGILRTYNENSEYAARVLRIMKKIGPEQTTRMVFN